MLLERFEVRSVGLSPKEQPAVLPGSPQPRSAEGLLHIDGRDWPAGSKSPSQQGLLFDRHKVPRGSGDVHRVPSPRARGQVTGLREAPAGGTERDVSINRAASGPTRTDARTGNQSNRAGGSSVIRVL